MAEVKRYSESFKLQVVEAIEAGKFQSLSEAKTYYGITGGETLTKWLKKYGKNHLLPKMVRIETVDDQNQIEHLKKRIKLLEKALTETRLDQILAESYFEVVCEEFGITDFDAMKKKLDSKRLKKG